MKFSQMDVLREAELIVKNIRARNSGMGQPELMKKWAEAGAVKTIRETISPWLWILSVTGFGLALINTRRISKMFKSWKVKARRE